MSVTALDFLPLEAPACLGDSFGQLSSSQIISLRAAAPRVKCLRFAFPRGKGFPATKSLPQPARDRDPPLAKPHSQETTLEDAGPSTVTRFRPPEDVVKLEDRLFYLLQPPLESILGSGELELPFEPFHYQLGGISFLYPRHAAILADEMGLGKTMQAITSLRLLLHAHEVRSAILICPKPLIPNWRREFDLWATEIPVAVIEGSSEQRAWAWQRTECPVKIANYEAVIRDQDLIGESGISADLVILDEAQRIKNMGSTTSQVVRAIPRKRSWALTGTPIENSTDDLIGIFEFLSEGTLHRSMGTRDLAHATRDYIIRRTKDDVQLDMPPKLFRDAWLELSPSQQARYDEAEGEGVVRLEDLGTAITVQHVFELVIRLKQICNFDPVTGDSSKLDRLEADLEEVAQSGKKAIIFSQWVQTLRSHCRTPRSLPPFGVPRSHPRQATGGRHSSVS